jgi:hypothetical protein
MGAGIPDSPVNPDSEKLTQWAAERFEVPASSLDAVILIGYGEMFTKLISTVDPQQAIAVLMAALEAYAKPTWAMFTDEKGEQTIVVHPKEAN